MKVRSVIPDPRSGTPILLLEDFETGQKWLPLWIGVAEANSILMALQRTAVPRPMTHDLLRNLVHDLKARVLRITITDLRENTFIATIYLQTAKETLQVDSRPSDAVALALRTESPIFVSSQVLARAGQTRAAAAAATSELAHYGLTIQEITKDLLPHFQGAKAGSILITDVKAGSSSARNGLKRGDVVLQVNNLQVEGLESFLSLLRVARAKNKNVHLSVSRGEERLRVDLTR
jgi:bifunctional DNase/RNase